MEIVPWIAHSYAKTSGEPIHLCPAEDAWSENIFLFCCSYTKVVAKGMKKAEMILKVKTFPGIVSLRELNMVQYF